MRIIPKTGFLFSLHMALAAITFTAASETPTINDVEYFETKGLNVMVFDDYYPDGHQGGISIIHHGVRTATNGDLRLSQDPGQWQPIPKKGLRTVDRKHNEISVEMSYPDENKHQKGYNPLIYPDLQLGYKVSVRGIDSGIAVEVDLDEPIPEAWVGKIGFHLELFPTLLFGKSYLMDDTGGIFPQQANGPFYVDGDGTLQIEPLAKGRRLIIAPESPHQQMTIESDTELQLLDGRGNHNNGWFVVRSVVPANATKGAIRWQITTKLDPDWTPEPVIQVSQIGYHPNQKKIAYIELDRHTEDLNPAILLRLTEKGGWEPIITSPVSDWGNFLRYRYGILDFSEVSQPGLYRVKYGQSLSHPFRIDRDVYSRHVWQPTMEYFLPVQMCHMRVNEKYRVWHDTCHLDDALMAPPSIQHYDGYLQGDSTLTAYAPLEPVPGLNRGGWHDAGDYDLRVESQINTVRALALAYELFSPDFDQTYIDQKERWVEIHQPDQKNDFLQQIEHGLLSVIGGYDALGRLYRGIIAPTLRQYVMLGDAVSMSDGEVCREIGEEAQVSGSWYQQVANRQSKHYDPHRQESAYRFINEALDDRLVFTEENPIRSLMVAGGLACASRTMWDYRPDLAKRSLEIAIELWNTYSEVDGEYTWRAKIGTAVDLALSTDDPAYIEFLLQHRNEVVADFENSGYELSRVLDRIEDEAFLEEIHRAASQLKEEITAQQAETPYGVPYRPRIWGDGWRVQHFGIEQYFLHQGWPELFPAENFYNAIHFVLGCHPGSNTASFVSGVGSHSVTTAYGVNRADWSYIPGGVVSGTALIRPDFPELLEWPYLWQQTEYVMGGGATNFVFLVLAAEHTLNE